MHEIIMDHYLKPISYGPYGVGHINGHTAPKLNRIALHQKYAGYDFGAERRLSRDGTCMPSQFWST